MAAADVELQVDSLGLDRARESFRRVVPDAQCKGCAFTYFFWQQ